MKKPYFVPEEISYTNRQLIFILSHLHEIEAGCWPELENELLLPQGGIIEGSDTTPGSKILYKPDPLALRIANEVNIRLKMCGRDGLIVKMRFADHKTVKEVSEKFGIERTQIFWCTHRCIKFMEGRHRPKGQYKEAA